MSRHPQPDGTPPLIVPFARLGRADLALAGGKGANLGELVRAGLPVPQGVVVSTVAYERFVAANGLAPVIAAALEAPAGGAALRAAFEGAQLPSELGAALLEAYRGLGCGPVAVRSSATAEDLPEAAFAGQHDTFLNVIGAAALLEAVRRCWASLWTDRAIAYRQRQGLDQATVKLAVVIQLMVPAEVAGVLFTANPVTGSRDETLIDASPGLGEAVVAGLVTPDHIVLRRGRWRWRIVERTLGRHEVVVRALPGGSTEEVAGPGAASAAALPDGALRALAALGETIEAHFGAPQDVEWAWAGGRPAILQARPITALPAPAPRVSKRQQALLGNFAEILAVRPYPFDMSTWAPGILGMLARVMGLVGIRPPRQQQVFVEEEGVVVRLNKPDVGPTPRVLLAPLRVLLTAARNNPRRWEQHPLLAELLALARQLEARDPASASWQELTQTIRAGIAITDRLGDLRRDYYPRAILGTVVLRVLLKLLGASERSVALLSGVESKTIKANRVLEALAAQVRASPALAAAFACHEPAALSSVLAAEPAGRAWLAQLQGFLDRYGYRETVIVGASHPTWKHAPELVLGIIEGLVAAAPPPPATPPWEEARDALLARPLLRLTPLRALFLRALAQARCLPLVREDSHFYAVMPMTIWRSCALELGRRMVAAGIVEAHADVFHLKLEELETAGPAWPPAPERAAQLRALVARRKERRAALEGTPLIAPHLYRAAPTARDALLHGSAGSPGLAEGQVRIVHDSTEFSTLLPGEVLVAHFTNPSWTPLFQCAAAVVVDTGGPASHAAIVAREYGIPAVMGTGDGTRRLANGQRVRVDGTQGTVSSAEPA